MVWASKSPREQYLGIQEEAPPQGPLSHLPTRSQGPLGSFEVLLWPQGLLPLLTWPQAGQVVPERGGWRLLT